MSKIMLLGDSIRMSYESRVTEALEQTGHQVWGPPENGQFSLYTLSSLGRWLAEFPSPDIVHWNNGLHDSGYNPARSPLQIPIDVYADNLRFIGQRLGETGATAIFATSTPVHPTRQFSDESWSWHNDEIDSYNEAARAIMAELAIPINDLHALITSDYDRFLAADKLHLSETGQQACSDQVLGSIRELL